MSKPDPAGSYPRGCPRTRPAPKHVLSLRTRLRIFPSVPHPLTVRTPHAHRSLAAWGCPFFTISRMAAFPPRPAPPPPAPRWARNPSPRPQLPAAGPPHGPRRVAPLCRRRPWGHPRPDSDPSARHASLLLLRTDASLQPSGPTKRSTAHTARFLPRHLPSHDTLHRSVPPAWRPSSPPEPSLILVTAPRPACHKVFQATLHNFSSWPDRELLHSEGCYGHTDWHHLPLSAPALRANAPQTSDSRSLVCAPRSSANTGSCWTSRRGFYESQMR